MIFNCSSTKIMLYIYMFFLYISVTISSYINILIIILFNPLPAGRARYRYIGIVQIIIQYTMQVGIVCAVYVCTVRPANHILLTRHPIQPLYILNYFTLNIFSGRYLSRTYDLYDLTSKVFSRARQASLSTPFKSLTKSCRKKTGFINLVFPRVSFSNISND